MEFRLLGPVEVHAHGKRLDLGTPRQRTVLAALLVEAHQPVRLDTLIERVWDDDMPADPRPVLYGYISRLRRTLQPDGLGPIRVAGGYKLTVDPDLVDLHRFRRLAASASDPRQTTAQQAHTLAAALDLWTGTPLADLRGTWPERMRAAWRHEQLDTVIAWAETEIGRGRPAAVIEPARRYAADNPLAESVSRVLIRALAATGRQAEALDLYAALRARLVEELGCEPDPMTQRVHQALLQGQLLAPSAAVPPGRPARSNPGWPVPAQLPSDVRAFAGRTTELATMDALVAAATGPGPVVVISGTAGVGKTALAVRWSHRAADWFPDGQLYVNLRGFDPGGLAVPAASAVRRFLDALGVPAERVPADLDAQAALYRTLLSGKRVLVVLDNARDADHARPLVPGAPTTLAIVTSRDPLTDLVASDGAQPIALDLLTAEEAGTLLARGIGTDRVSAEPAAAHDIITACARLPLALALVAARARAHPTFTLTALATELDTGAAGRLDLGDLLTRVRTVFFWSYATLTPAAAALFRHLGLHPGPDITAAAAASLTATPLTDCRRSLTELTRAGLLEEHSPGRYGFHDLLRAYAADLARSTDADSELHAAIGRLLDHYAHTAHTADKLLYPARDAIPLALTTPAPGVSPEQPANHQQALAWLAAEHPNVLAAHALAAETGHDTLTWQLAWALDTFLDRGGRLHELAASWQSALTAAQRLGDLTVTAHAHRAYADTQGRLGHYDSAHTHLQQSLQLHQRVDDQVGQAHAHIHLSILSERHNRTNQALQHAQQALALYCATDHQRGRALALNAVGWDHALLGHHAKALTYCQQALALHQQTGDRDGEAATWDSLGYAHHHLGNHTEAVDSYQHALALYRDLGDRYYQADTLTHLGDTHHAAGHLKAARSAWTIALHILTDLGHPNTQPLHTRLATPHIPTAIPDTQTR